jgi:5-formyltetrahydrofolate cyclo-ligase
VGQEGLTAPDLAAEKRALRRQIGTRRQAIAGAERRAAGEAIARHVLRALVGRRVRRWAVYADLPDEVPTRSLFEAIRRVSIPLLPRIEGRRLAFAPVRSWSDLRPGVFGVLEPPRGTPGVRLAPEDAVVLPGVAFDRSGHRLGRGAGLYDRTFGGAGSQPLLIGAGYAFQLLAHVPHGGSDRKVGVVVTDRGWIWPGNRI